MISRGYFPEVVLRFAFSRQLVSPVLDRDVKRSAPKAHRLHAGPREARSAGTDGIPGARKGSPLTARRPSPKGIASALPFAANRMKLRRQSASPSLNRGCATRGTRRRLSRLSGQRPTGSPPNCAESRQVLINRALRVHAARLPLSRQTVCAVCLDPGPRSSYSRPSWRASLSASMAAPRAPAVSPLGIT